MATTWTFIPFFINCTSFSLLFLYFFFLFLDFFFMMFSVLDGAWSCKIRDSEMVFCISEWALHTSWNSSWFAFSCSLLYIYVSYVRTYWLPFQFEVLLNIDHFRYATFLMEQLFCSIFCRTQVSNELSSNTEILWGDTEGTSKNLILLSFSL